MNTIIKILIIPIILLIWAFIIEPNIIVTQYYKIKNDNLKNIRIIYVSDFHLKQNDYKKIKKIVNKINKYAPDIVLLGGDFVNGQTYKSSMNTSEIAKNIAKIKSQNGIYAVLGNHDRWFEDNSVITELQKQRIVVLLNSNKKVIIKNKIVYIAGVDDYTTTGSDIEKALKNTSKNTILLSHSPDIFPQVPGFVDLTLAGHTHGGQIIFPFIGALFIPSDYGTKYSNGLINENSKTMIVSKGIGTSTIHARFNCLPEIVLIDFI